MTHPPATEPMTEPAADTTTAATSSTAPTSTNAPGSAADETLGARSAPVTLTEHTHAVADQLRAAWTPPDVWRTGLPPLREIWEHELRGTHVPDDPRARAVAKAGAAVRFPVLALLYWLAWVWRSNSRVVVAGAFVISFLLFLT
ncbi:hypothetical protein [Lentzea sp. CA-135723]|uniref:hypothetical protein n=1 Tax=Lentzea sp. CA-135723 TaxID=3239950 RepID=UPI003D90DCCE